MTAAGRPGADRAADQQLSIGRVIEALRPDFPDISVSKVRFLENEGLVTPDRTPSGYRRFSPADVDRLRYVLTAQRDRYLPLKVIRSELERLDSAVASGDAVPMVTAGTVPGSTPDDFKAESVRRLTLESVVEQSGFSEGFVTELVDAGLVVRGPGGFFDPEAVLVVRAAAELSRHGVDVRHLRRFRTAAERQTDLISQLTTPVAMRGDDDAKDRAEELAREIAALSVTLHSTLVTVAVRRALEG